MKERLKMIISYLGTNTNAFARSVETSQQTLDNYIKGRTPSLEVIEKIVKKYPKIDCNWLITGEGEMLKNNIQNIENKHITEKIEHDKISTSNQTSLSISELKQRGYAPYYSDLAKIEQNEEPSDWIRIPGVTIEALFPIIGCSMEPKIYTGDTVGVVSLNNWNRIDPDKVYLITTDEDKMLKHLERDETDQNIIWAASENYRRFKISLNEIQAIYRIVWTGRFM